MWKKRCAMFIACETSVHPGSGSSIGIVDLPIQREVHTNFPKIESTSLKGCLRETFRRMQKNSFAIVEEIFGPEEIGEEAYAGAISITDAKLLLFPVKSVKGVFAYVTCPLTLNRFKKEFSSILGGKVFENVQIKESTVCMGSDLLVDSKSIILEEFSFDVGEDEGTTNIAKELSNLVFPNDPAYKFWREKLQKSLVILPDNDFRDFVTNSTEVVTRIKIDTTTGTVQRGALWTEEYLPQDTILYSFVLASEPRKKGATLKDENEVFEKFKVIDNLVMQIGGNQTVGKGLVRVKLYESNQEGDGK
ncbi:type III-B CRISPR module RAMP protein Cmr4 [Pseudothermotoga thermarum]|uniref:CRISPR-associated RAMP protein, Cmr4 family n=1 Tax=Pseudothermotoga thermarum DSM 5069 TaxID=688269 RepID=F7YTM4_9THEM|nr:type III-B CRISPR module RAMP protein Cmr4 [Pseudothermotoga thermarum]AEH51246.1 CRISPR-associated RAMP protein, Cmr4 family [Pseudothermotoga thermarum DSM 5069]